MDVQLLNACLSGYNDDVKNILELGRLDINAAVNVHGYTALIWAVFGIQPSIVKTLLSSPDIRLDPADENGSTALHWACGVDKRSSLIPLLAQHTSCTSENINKRNKLGETPLMFAVDNHNLVGVKEMGKLEGTNFRTKNNRGQTLLDVARRSKYYENEDDEIIKYLLEKQKKETLEEKAAYHVATNINNDDVEKLEIPRTLYSLVTKFLDF